MKPSGQQFQVGEFSTKMKMELGNSCPQVLPPGLGPGREDFILLNLFLSRKKALLRRVANMLPPNMTAGVQDMPPPNMPLWYLDCLEMSALEK